MSSPLEVFFARFARKGFTYKGSLSAHDNFKNLREVLKRNGNFTKSERTALHEDFNDARVQQFNFIYGRNSDLGAWRNLCTVINIKPAPDSIKECQSRVWDAHVNIVDLVEAARTGGRVQTFATLEKLKAYTTSPGKRFPIESAYTGGLLKDLLREIVNPYHGKRRSGSRNQKKGKTRQQAAIKPSLS